MYSCSKIIYIVYTLDLSVEFHLFRTTLLFFPWIGGCFSVKPTVREEIFYSFHHKLLSIEVAGLWWNEGCTQVGRKCTGWQLIYEKNSALSCSGSIILLCICTVPLGILFLWTGCEIPSLSACYLVCLSLTFGFGMISPSLLQTLRHSVTHTNTHTCPQAVVDLPKLSHGLSGGNDLVGATYSS